MQVACSTNTWKCFSVATLVARWICAVNFCYWVKGLMNIANVVDSKTESDRSCISLSGEILDNLLIIVGSFIISSTSTKPFCDIFKGANDIVSGGDKGKVRNITTFIKIRDINEVPVWLKTIVTLNIISKSCTFSKWVSRFSHKGWVRQLQRFKLSKSGTEDSWIFWSKKSFSLSWD